MAKPSKDTAISDQVLSMAPLILRSPTRELMQVRGQWHDFLVHLGRANCKSLIMFPWQDSIISQPLT